MNGIRPPRGGLIPFRVAQAGVPDYLHYNCSRGIRVHFIWDGRNKAHLAEHGVLPAAAEAVFFAKDRAIIESTQGLGRYECEGSYKGRMYRLIFTAITDEALYPITCFPIRKRRNP